MTPYYQDALVTLYLGDAREVLPALTLTSPAVVITDPPYGIAWQQHGGGRNGKTRGSRRHIGIVGDTDTSLRDEVIAILPPVPMAVFGSFRAPFPQNVRQVLIFQRAPDAGLMGSVTGFRTDVDPIFLIGPWPIRTARWSSVIASSIGLQRLQAGSSHPHAKPVDVLARLIEAAPAGTVLDPFAGSGSTLVAAKALGRRSVGVEIEERYCATAARRLSQEALGLPA